MSSDRPLLKHLAFGLAAGAVISIVPIELGILVIPGLLVLWIVAIRRRPAGLGASSYIFAGIVALATVSVAAVLPVKHLDQKVPPISYERRTLDELAEALRKDYRIFVSTPYPQSQNTFVEFRTGRAMTKREVLQKLAEATGCDLHIRYCGSGASFLFGSHPSFTRLDLKIAQVGAANRSQGIGPGTNRTSAAAGSSR